MKIYEIILESGNDICKVFVPAENAKKARIYVQGNGEVVRIKESAEYTNNKISIDAIEDALRVGGFGDIEVTIITRALTQINIAE